MCVCVLFMHLCAHVCVDVHAQKCACGGQDDGGCLPLLLCTACLRHGPSLNLELAICLGGLASHPPDPLVSSHSVLGLQGCTLTPGFHMRVFGITAEVFVFVKQGLYLLSLFLNAYFSSILIK